MDKIPEALTAKTSGPIFVSRLAEIIGVPCEKLRPLVEHGYLRTRVPSEHLGSTIVARPGERALEWLRMMFQPFEMRPQIPLSEVGKLWGITGQHILKYCKLYQIPVYADPVFGNLMSFNALKSYARARRKYYKRKPLDRAGFLRFYLSEIWGERWKEPPPYSERLETEIRRIASLQQPWKTIRSIALVEAFRDARTAAECIRDERKLSEELVKCERSVEELREKVLTQEWRSKARRRAEMKRMEQWKSEAIGENDPADLGSQPI